LRLVLGSDSYQAIESALRLRLEEVRGQRDSAGVTDAPLEGVSMGGPADLND
jgi:hypothetical protein